MDLVCIEGVANNDILCFMKNSGVGNEIDDCVVVCLNKCLTRLG